MEEEPPKTKSFSQVIWLVLNKPTRCLYHYVIMFLTLMYSTFAPTTISSKVEPPPRPQPPSPSFSSLPDEIVMNILARIPKSYYPKVSLVSKTFHSLIFSLELYNERVHIRNDENILHVCLQLPTSHRPSWFSLWIKPDQTLTNDLEKMNNPNPNTLLVPVPCPYSPRVPHWGYTIGLETYVISRCNSAPSSMMFVRNKDEGPSIYGWRKAPSMKVARESPVMSVLDGKIYVMGGCSPEESRDWAEVFDPKTQTWESLPDPGAELRSSSIKRTAWGGPENICVKSSLNMDYVYYPKEGRWDTQIKLPCFESSCVIENVCYYCGIIGVLWYDTKRQVFRTVYGLDVLNRNRPFGTINVANYGGKLLVFWDKLVVPHDCEKKDIWCAVIALERRNNGDDVWGNVEWASVVLTVPSSYVFLRCVSEFDLIKL